ncbi:hypothetical protein [Desulfosporosinus nitroreducens]|uniref:hypothetical protein n=1 Tax=Desulfosporosinus nitroreducens TaxID=2018668 RepID=UPI00207C579C|nr:hypothetical protein [Desulfosporosinus nitroreducens]MCO1601072.1 hypothetical protein [Desulfosporosinus nitroreducens]
MGEGTFHVRLPVLLCLLSVLGPVGLEGRLLWCLRRDTELVSQRVAGLGSRGTSLGRRHISCAPSCIALFTARSGVGGLKWKVALVLT